MAGKLTRHVGAHEHRQEASHGDVGTSKNAGSENLASRRLALGSANVDGVLVGSRGRQDAGNGSRHIHGDRGCSKGIQATN